ncbi:MAG: non-canonical purine NTP pyrophosphatase, partial [Terriglobia bacterium]
MPLYLASKNPGKLREFRDAALAFGIPVEPMPGIDELPACIEDGATFEANARKKTLHYARWGEGLVFADDSGICVDALGGAPGVFSARFSGDHSTDEANNRKLISELRRLVHSGAVTGDAGAGSPGAPAFPAHYECVIALANGGRILTTTEGRAEGLIILSPRGSGGFGYDPYFFYPPLRKT